MQEWLEFLQRRYSIEGGVPLLKYSEKGDLWLVKFLDDIKQGMQAAALAKQGASSRPYGG